MIAPPNCCVCRVQLYTKTRHLLKVAFKKYFSINVTTIDMVHYFLYN